MKRTLIAIALLSLPAAAAKNGLDTARIEQITGVKGKWNEKEGVFKVEMPRSDLAVTTAGTKMIPPLGLTAWAAFTKAGAHTVVMGDMVLTEDQVNPAMSAALDNGLQVTALHNHFFWQQPRVMFMHIGGMGDEARLAALQGHWTDGGPGARTEGRAGSDSQLTTSSGPIQAQEGVGRRLAAPHQLRGLRCCDEREEKRNVDLAREQGEKPGHHC